jgi:PIN domain nuclease of toxin-antitoxin system
MNLLLDTHIFIWLSTNPQQLSSAWRQILQDPTNSMMLSVVSLWEIQIKVQLGRLALPMPIKQLLAAQQTVNDLQILPVFPHHIWELDNLPLYHKDPFDRLLMAQAIAEKWQLVSMDSIFSQYPVQLFK